MVALPILALMIAEARRLGLWDLEEEWSARLPRVAPEIVARGWR